MTGPAELVLSGGRVWRGLGLPEAEAVAFAGGRVVATGGAAEVEPLVGEGTEVVPLGGRLVTPGLNDAHMHLLPYGVAMGEVDLRPAAAPTLDALLGAVAARAAESPPGGWVTGRGYDHFRLDTGRHPTRDELDAAAPDHPVWITRTDGHLSVANSRALALAGMDEGSEAPQGGMIERRDGRMTGLLAETARAPVQAVLPRPTEEALVEAIERAGRDLLSHGITSCMDAAVGMHAGWAEMVAYRRAHREGRLPVRVYACLLGDPGRSVLPRASEAGLVSGDGDDRLRIGPVKIFTDGSFGGRTAAVTRPYLGGEDTGLLLLDDEALTEAVVQGHRQGWRFAIHAIGDAAIEQVLGAYEAALRAAPDPDRRHRIEHCGWVRPDQVERMAALGVIPAPQPAFLHWFGELYLTLAERERVEASHPMRTWIRRGLHPSASTDCPVVEIDPRPNLHQMVTRETDRVTVLGADQALSMEEALHACTYEGAYGSHEEGLKGRLLPGQLGDAAVWDRDVLAEPGAVMEAVVDLTLLGGRIVHRRGGA
jgi:predicted amidohydrolase YtcJ